VLACLLTTIIFFVHFVFMCNVCVAVSGDDQLSDELVSVLSHRHLLEFIIERCSDVAPRFLHHNFSFYGAHTTLLTFLQPVCCLVILRLCFCQQVFAQLPAMLYTCVLTRVYLSTRVQPVLCSPADIFFNICLKFFLQSISCVCTYIWL